MRLEVIDQQISEGGYKLLRETFGNREPDSEENSWGQAPGIRRRVIVLPGSVDVYDTNEQGEVTKRIRITPQQPTP